jgi:alpha-galactosidase
MSDWLVPNERFPHGIQWLAERIREKGFKPGVWIAPLTAHESSELVREHPDWLLRDAAGQVLSRDTHMGKVHTIDYTAPGAIEWLRTLIRTLVNDFGYRWIKLDGPIRRYYDGGVFRTPMTSVQHIRLALEVIRKEAGDAIVEGEGYYGPSIGLVDTQRVTQDIQQDWPRLKHTAQVNLLSTFMHRKLWINNPDAFILRDTPTPAMTVDGVPEYVMDREEVQTEVTALALTGGVVMLTDRMKDLKPERKALVDCFVPVYEEPARPVDLFNGKVCPEVFRQRVFAEGESWEVVAVFNWEDEPRAMEAPIGREERVAFEFWTQKYLGVVRGVLAFDSVPAHGVRLVALRPVLDRPFVMGTSLHVTQGGVELRKQNWDPRAGLLTFTLRSWMKRDASVHVRLPGGSWVADVRCTSRLNSYAQHGSEHLAIAFAAGGEVGFEVLIAPSSVSS